MKLYRVIFPKEQEDNMLLVLGTFPRDEHFGYHRNNFGWGTSMAYIIQLTDDEVTVILLAIAGAYAVCTESPIDI
jgi:hypothetical protein